MKFENMTPATRMQVLIIMLTRGTDEQKREAFNVLGFRNSMIVLRAAS